MKRVDSGSESEKDALLPKLKTSDSVQYDVRPSSGGKAKGFVIVLTLVSALGGFLFGYDTGVVSGAMLKVRDHFTLSSTWVEIIVSVTIGTAALAAVVAGLLCDLIGRKWTLLLAATIFTIGSVVLGAAVTTWMLLIGRVIVGVGIGIAAMSVPMYIAESAPANMRGKLVVVNIMFVTGGQFIATVIDGVFSYLGENVGWRFMFALAGVPSLLMFFGLLFMPESPRWLVFHGKTEKARNILHKIRPHDQVEGELKAIVADHEEYMSRQQGLVEFVIRFCTTKPLLLALLVGCGLQLFQQFAGINTVMYYSASIIQMAGFSDQDAIWLSTVPGFANFFFTIVGLVLVDRLGRRKLLIGSVTGTIFGFLLLSATFLLMDHFSPPSEPLKGSECQYYSCGACVANSNCGFCVDVDNITSDYWNGTCSTGEVLTDGSTQSKHLVNGTSLCAVVGENYTFDLTENSISFQRRWSFFSCPENHFAPLAIFSLFLYIMFFAPGMGPLPWTVNSEIYPTWARSTAISIATLVNWCANLVVSMTFLTLADNLGQPSTFGLYSGLSFLGLLFIVFFVPETKGRSLEEVDQLFQRPYFMTWCQRKRNKTHLHVQ